MRAHLVQLDIAWKDREANFGKVDGLLATTEIAPGDLIVLPEMFDSGVRLNVERTQDGQERTLSWWMAKGSHTGQHFSPNRDQGPVCGL